MFVHFKDIYIFNVCELYVMIEINLFLFIIRNLFSLEQVKKIKTYFPGVGQLFITSAFI